MLKSQTMIRRMQALESQRILSSKDVWRKIPKNSKSIEVFINAVGRWCETYLGYNMRKEYTPTIEHDWVMPDDMPKSHCGQYDPSENVIYVQIHTHIYWQELAATLIHEWCHYLQSSTWYDRYYTMGYQYHNHPYEIEAESVSRVLSASCTTYALNCLKISTTKRKNNHVQR